MPYFNYNFASRESATEREHSSCGGGATMYHELAALHNSINSGNSAGTFFPSQEAAEDSFDDVRRLQASHGNIIHSPRMSQGTTDYGTSMTIGHVNSGGSDASTLLPCHTDRDQRRLRPQRVCARQRLIVPAQATAPAPTWTPKDLYAFLMDEFVAAGMNTHRDPAPAIQHSSAIDTAYYPPPNDPPPGYLPYVSYDLPGSRTEPADVPAPAPVAYPDPDAAPSGFANSAGTLHVDSQLAQSAAQYTLPKIGTAGYSVDPHQLHVTSSSIWDPQTAHEASLSYAAHRAQASPPMPSLGYSSGSAATSVSPTTPTGLAILPARALGKRKAVDTGFDGEHDNHHDHSGAAQTSAQPRPRPVKRPRVAKQPARVATTVDPHVGIPNQTGDAALTRTTIYSKASGRGAQDPTSLTSEDIPGAGAGPSRARPKTRARGRKRNVLPPGFVPLYKQDPTLEQVEAAARKMTRRELIDNLTEVTDAPEPKRGNKDGTWCACRWPECPEGTKRGWDTRRHIDDIHLNRGTKCPKCGKGFRGPSEVKRHVGGAQCKPEDEKTEAKVETKARRRRRQ